MRKLGLVLGLLVVTLAHSPAAGADPSHSVQPPVTMTCDNGESVLVNPGTVTNQSREAFVISSDGSISSTSILVINYLALTDGTDTIVLFDSAPGLTSQGLVICTTDLGGGISLVVRGFFTPGV
jgi:hypothetical protein